MNSLNETLQFDRSRSIIVKKTFSPIHTLEQAETEILRMLHHKLEEQRAVIHLIRRKNGIVRRIVALIAFDKKAQEYRKQWIECLDMDESNIEPEDEITLRLMFSCLRRGLIQFRSSYDWEHLEVKTEGAIRVLVPEELEIEEIYKNLDQGGSR